MALNFGPLSNSSTNVDDRFMDPDRPEEGVQNLDKTLADDISDFDSQILREEGDDYRPPKVFKDNSFKEYYEMIEVLRYMVFCYLVSSGKKEEIVSYFYKKRFLTVKDLLTQIADGNDDWYKLVEDEEFPSLSVTNRVIVGSRKSKNPRSLSAADKEKRDGKKRRVEFTEMEKKRHYFGKSSARGYKRYITIGGADMAKNPDQQPDEYKDYMGTYGRASKNKKYKYILMDDDILSKQKNKNLLPLGTVTYRSKKENGLVRVDWGLSVEEGDPSGIEEFEGDAQKYIRIVESRKRRSGYEAFVEPEQKPAYEDWRNMKPPPRQPRQPTVAVPSGSSGPSGSSPIQHVVGSSSSSSIQPARPRVLQTVESLTDEGCPSLTLGTCPPPYTHTTPSTTSDAWQAEKKIDRIVKAGTHMLPCLEWGSKEYRAAHVGRNGTNSLEHINVKFFDIKPGTDPAKYYTKCKVCRKRVAQKNKPDKFRFYHAALIQITPSIMLKNKERWVRNLADRNQVGILIPFPNMTIYNEEGHLNVYWNNGEVTAVDPNTLESASHGLTKEEFKQLQKDMTDEVNIFKLPKKTLWKDKDKGQICKEKIKEFYRKLNGGGRRSREELLQRIFLQAGGRTTNTKYCRSCKTQTDHVNEGEGSRSIMTCQMCGLTSSHTQPSWKLHDMAREHLRQEAVDKANVQKKQRDEKKKRDESAKKATQKTLTLDSKKLKRRVAEFKERVNYGSYYRAYKKRLDDHFKNYIIVKFWDMLIKDPNNIHRYFAFNEELPNEQEMNGQFHELVMLVDRFPTSKGLKSIEKITELAKKFRCNDVGKGNQATFLGTQLDKLKADIAAQLQPGTSGEGGSSSSSKERPPVV